MYENSYIVRPNLIFICVKQGDNLTFIEYSSIYQKPNKKPVWTTFSHVNHIFEMGNTYLHIWMSSQRMVEYPFKVCSCWHLVKLLDAECWMGGGRRRFELFSLCFSSCSPYSITNFMFGNISLRVRLFLSSTFCYFHCWLFILHKSVLFTFWKVISSVNVCVWHTRIVVSYAQ